MDALFQRNFEVLAALARHRARCGRPAPCGGSSGTVRLCQDRAALLSGAGTLCWELRGC